MPEILLETLTGLIERVTFHSEESGFAVLRVKVRGQRDLITAVGTVATVTAGEWLTAEGRWVRDREHGLQFKAESLQCSPPTSRAGIEKYLASGMIHGIGPVYAKKLVEHFGEEIFDVIEHHSARLEEIPGVGPGRRRRIKEAWAEQKVVRDIMVFLHSHGVSTSRAVRIYKLYGDQAVQRVQEDPYGLARHIPGIGFKTADQIAEHLGIGKDSPLRAKAAIAHMLLEAGDNGHCALPRPLLLEQTAELLAAPGAPVEPCLDQLLGAGELVEEPVGGDRLVFVPAMRRAEVGIADRIARLAAAAPTLPPIDAGKAIPWCEGKTGKQLAPQQRAAIEGALARRAQVVTGGPGVGKTTLIHSLLLILRAKKVRCALCAPTGRAARRMFETTGFPAKTIHRLLEFDPRTGDFSRHERRPLECDFLVVDETSMVDVPLLFKLLRALPPPAHLLLVGDADQLPSVGPGLALADLIASGRLPVVRLTQVFRQAAASRIITTAHGIREGHIPRPAQPPDPDADFHFLERDTPEAIQATVLQLVGERIPRKIGGDPRTQIQVLTPMNRGSLGAQVLNGLLQNALNPARPGEPAAERFGWQFRVGDKVIQTVNNYDKDVFNGDLGLVDAIDPEARLVRIQYDGRLVEYGLGELDEVAPAYAITIHKAQGSEFPAVVIPLATQHYLLLQRNLIYTGITRGKQLVVVVGQPRALAMAVRNDRTARRYSGLLDRLRGAAGAVAPRPL